MRPTNRSRLATTASTAATAVVVIAGILSVPTVASADRSDGAKSRTVVRATVSIPPTTSNIAARFRAGRGPSATAGATSAALAF